MGFPSPSTHEPWRIHLSGAYLTPYVALPGFLTLSALCSPPRLPTLFHAGSVHGVSPFRASSSRGAVPPLGGRCLLDVHSSRSTPRDVNLPRETDKVRCLLRARSRRLGGHPARLASPRHGRWTRGPGDRQACPSIGCGRCPPVRVGSPRRVRPKPGSPRESSCAPGRRRAIRAGRETEASRPTWTGLTPCGQQGWPGAAAGAEAPPGASSAACRYKTWIAGPGT
jgi:hypothetical protein